jgi:hypothetical protein
MDACNNQSKQIIIKYLPRRFSKWIPRVIGCLISLVLVMSWCQTCWTGSLAICLGYSWCIKVIFRLTAFSCANWHRSDCIIESLSSIGCVYSQNCNYVLVLVFSPFPSIINQFIVSSLLCRRRLNFVGCIENEQGGEFFCFCKRSLYIKSSICHFFGYCRLSYQNKCLFHTDVEFM